MFESRHSDCFIAFNGFSYLFIWLHMITLEMKGENPDIKINRS